MINNNCSFFPLSIITLSLLFMVLIIVESRKTKTNKTKKKTINRFINFFLLSN